MTPIRGQHRHKKIDPLTKERSEERENRIRVEKDSFFSQFLKFLSCHIDQENVDTEKTRGVLGGNMESLHLKGRSLWRRMRDLFGALSLLRSFLLYKFCFENFKERETVIRKNVLCCCNSVWIFGDRAWREVSFLQFKPSSVTILLFLIE